MAGFAANGKGRNRPIFPTYIPDLFWRPVLFPSLSFLADKWPNTLSRCSIAGNLICAKVMYGYAITPRSRQFPTEPD